MSPEQADRLIRELSNIDGQLFGIHQLLCIMLVVLSAQLLVNLFRK